MAFWWLDWCCDESIVSMPGLTPDSWIDHLYAQEMVNQGQRGFVLARIGSSNGDPAAGVPGRTVVRPHLGHRLHRRCLGNLEHPGPGGGAHPGRGDHRRAVCERRHRQLPGATAATEPQDPADLYDRWVQFGTFQPILRLHSNDEQRLPWQYPQPVRGITEDFLRLREALIPYTYTLAAQAHDDGLPITQPLYLDYPDQAAAYTHPEEYLYGSDVLVAPVTSPGAVADTTVWIPPGRWVDYFTGATFTGPATTTVSVPLSRMPVFVRAGGIIPEQTVLDHVLDHGRRRSIVLKVFSGSSGSFTLYGDSGTGLGYTKGQYTETPITDSVGSTGTPARTRRRPRPLA